MGLDDLVKREGAGDDRHQRPRLDTVEDIGVATRKRVWIARGVVAAVALEREALGEHR